MKKHWQIRTHLGLLMLSVALPLTGLVLYSSIAFFNHVLFDADQLVRAVSEITASDTESYLHDRQLVLARIAERPLVRGLDPERCDPILNDYRDFDSNLSNILVMNANGDVICSAIDMPVNNKINYASSPNFNRVMKEDRFIYGYPSFGKISKRWVLPLAYPIHNTQGDIIGVMGAAVDLEKYESITGKTSINNGIIVTLVDQHGRIISRNQDPAHWIGKDMAQHPFFRYVSKVKSGSAQMTGFDGREMVYGFSRLPDIGWYALAGMPTDLALLHARLTAIRDGSLILVIFIITTIIGIYVARMIERPVRKIAMAADAITSGHIETRLHPEGPLEIAEISNQMNTMLDVRQAANKTIQQSEEHMRLAMEAAQMGSWEIDLESEKISYSDSYAELFGHDDLPDFISIKSWLDKIYPSDRDNVEAALEKTIRDKEPYSIEFRIVHADQSIRWIASRGRLIFNRQGKPEKLIGISMDISERRASDEQMRYLATHDPLTGLVNRREFENHVEETLKQARKQNSQHAMLYMDLDQFKIVNDTCGHIAGDELLRQLATILNTRVRESDTLARLGGDEFGMLLKNCPLQNAVKVAEEIRHVINEFRFVWKDKNFNIGVSIGLVAITDNSMSLEQVFSAADAACFVAKDHGRNRVHVHHAEDIALAQHHGEMEWVSRINHALTNRQFRLYYQPIIPLHKGSNEIMHCEILIRMQGADGNLIPPMAFIPAAERYGIMTSIDRWLIQNAFRNIRRWQRDQKDEQLIFTINLSGNSLNDSGLLDFVREMFVDLDVAPYLVCFEVTETIAIANLTQAQKFIKEMKSLGCRFALDDFGSGMSSFTYLKNLSVDYLKIDGSFVTDMLHDPIDRAMVQSINNVGQIMGIKTIAEFVENDQTLEMLREIGVNYAQGYGIAKPAPIEKLFTSPRLKLVQNNNH